MSIHTSFDDRTHTYTISIGGQKIVGISDSEYRWFIGEVRDGTHNATTLIHEARIRHQRSVSA